MPSRIVVVVLLVVAGVLYYQGSPISAGLAIGCLGYYVLNARIRLWAGDAASTAPSSNTLINCRLGIEHILAHQSIARLHASLLARNKVATPTAEAWAALLAENYKAKYGRSEPVDEVTFQVKNSVLFKNDKPELYNDSIYHVITIPYDTTKDSDKRSFLTPAIETEVEIRLLLVNGILTVQVGAFDEASSPQVLRPGSLAVYQTYETITVFPLMYFSWQLDLPVPYLNLSAYATESYKAFLSEKDHKKMFADWRVIQQDAAIYRGLCESEGGRSSRSLPAKASERLKAKADEIIQKNGFTTNKRDGDGWRYPDAGKDFWNPYLYVMFQNMNLRRSFAEQHWLVDYYETTP